jgi:nitroreductase
MPHSPYFSHPVTELIRARYSCRTYQAEPLPGWLAESYARLEDAIALLPPGPFGSASRILLARGGRAEDGGKELRRVGTYGFIRGTPGYMLGAVPAAEGGREQPPSSPPRGEPKRRGIEAQPPSSPPRGEPKRRGIEAQPPSSPPKGEPKRRGIEALEDYGYRLEIAVLQAADLDLGTCWLGGTFTRSSFSQLIQLQPGEILPAVIAVGAPAGQRSRIESAIRAQAQSDNRLAWDSQFFEGSFDRPLSRDSAGAFAETLEMVRLAPSASNKQPWRVVHAGGAWHFYRRRTPGYRDGLITRLLGVADMQRIDLGIAMAHFELAAREAGLPGEWCAADPGIPLPDGLTEYLVSWGNK